MLVDRLDREYKVSIGLEPLPFQAARWVTGPEKEIQGEGSKHGRRLVDDVDGHPMLLFDTEWTLGRTKEQSENLTFHDVQPRGQGGS